MELYHQKHIDYIKAIDANTDELAHWLSAHLRLNGIYWGVTAVWLLGDPQALDPVKVVEFVLSCYDSESGGFSAYPKHDPHLLFTLSALQVLFIENKLHLLPNKQKTVEFIVGLQGEQGEVSGDIYGEVDARFMYTAIQSLVILGELDSLNVESASKWLAACQNYDGGFGCVPEAESHGAMAFTVVGSLCMLGKLNLINTEKASWWLSDRQTQFGGFNGRPEKLPDVCYSWWVLSAMSMIHAEDMIDKSKLIEYILKAQDPEKGGIADREENEVDLFHTFFGVAALSLLGYPGLQPVNPVFCLPESVASKLPEWPGKTKYEENLQKKIEILNI